ncbi:MAG: NPCBM/NEW2 domain-containing protein, partial [Bifidobacteriaceae bacterium]|nr:NPCBM/NEW2 domain-containing protein [Bifidobacteriaceae bacterium]
AEYGELPQPTRLGYDFEGWYTQKEGGEKIGGSTHVAIGKDHTLYAHWRVKPETYLADLTQYEWAGSSGAWSRRTEPGREVLDNHNAIHSYGFVGQEDSVSLLDPNTVTYDIERAYARFTGAWGLQEQSGTTMEGGRALWLEIHGDGRLIYTSPEISSGSAVKPIDIDVSGVQYLKFVLCSNIPPSERIPYWTGYGLFDPILIR